MSHAVATFGRFNAPTETGHGKLIAAVQQHAENVGAKHYIFPSHTQDPKKNPLSHGEKIGFMRRLFPTANVVSNKGIRNVIDAMKHLESKGHKEVTMVVGSDRVGEFKSLLNKYRTKEFPNIKKVNVKSAGRRDPDAEGAEGMSASKLRALVAAGKRDEFISHYSDKKLGAEIHDKIKKGMQMESTSPIGIFLLGGPGSGKDYVLNNIFSRFDLVEVQIDQILSGNAFELTESKKNIVINGAADADKIQLAKAMLEGYEFDHVYVSVSNKVSKVRNESREQPLLENKRLEKWYRAEKLAEGLDCFVFNNSINLHESTEMEKVFFASQIEKLLERVSNHGLTILEESNPKSFVTIKEKYAPVAKDKESGLPKKYVAGLSSSTAKARKAHWKKMSKLSDRDPRAYEPAPGDKTAETKPSKHTLAVRKMMANEAEELPKKLRHVAKSGNITAVKERQKENKIEESDSSLAAKAAKSGVSVSTLRKVYKRGVAAWNSGHRPGTTPQQWGHARVNSYINKGKTYHTADKDLREDVEQIDELDQKTLKSYIKKNVDSKAYEKSPNRDAGLERATAKVARNQATSTLKNKVSKLKYTSMAKHKNPFEYQVSRDELANRKVSEEVEQIDEMFEAELQCCPDMNEAVDLTPTISTKKPKKGKMTPGDLRSSTLDGLPTVSLIKVEEKKPLKHFMPTPRQVPGPKAGHPVPPGYERVKTWGGGTELRKIPDWKYQKSVIRIGQTGDKEKLKAVLDKKLSVKEAVEYHLENKISFTENVFRPGSDMFFEMISEAKRLYSEGTYEPQDEWEKDLLKSDIGEKAMFEGQEVLLDFPFEEEINEEDKTDGKGIGKPWREGGGGAVYVRTGDGGIKKVRFSQSGMAKKFNDPAATRSFVARHHCLSNKDKTSASYWACRYPRFFSNSGKLWW